MKVYLKALNKDIIKAIKNETYKVDINKTLLLFFWFSAFFFAIKKLKEVGKPVVVNARQIIKKLNNIWYIPKPDSHIVWDKNILYKKPKILTIKLEINKIMVEKIKLGIFKKTPPTLNIFIEGVKNNYNFINSGFILSNLEIYLKPSSFKWG